MFEFKHKILILEDMQERMVEFYKRFAGKNAEIVHVETASDCIRELENCDRFDLVFLDHDLGLRAYVPSSEQNTGGEVARWVRDHPEIWEKVNYFILHSINAPGRKYMQDTMSTSREIAPRIASMPGVWVEGAFEKAIRFN